jgi:moderate conductance mechanosensitive channel
MTILRSLLLALALALASATASQAQAPADLPAGMTQEQFDVLVEAISKSVAQKLKAEGIPAAAAPAKTGKGAAAAPAHPAAPRVALADRPDEFAIFLHRAGRVVVAFPELGRHLGLLPGLLDARPRGGTGPFAFLLLLGLIAAAAVTAEAIVRRILNRFRERLAAGSAPEQGLPSLVHLGLLLLLDGLGLAVVWLICRGAAGAWFAGTDGQDRLAVAVLTGIFAWRLYVLAFRVVLRPGLAPARLCAVDDGEARALYARIEVILLLIILWRILYQVLIALETPHDALAAFQVLGGIIYLVAFVWLALRSQVAARQWFDGLGTVSRWAGLVGRHWLGISLPFFIALGGTQIYGAISERLNVSAAMLLTLILVVALLFFETLLQAFVRRLDSQLPGRTPAGDVQKLPDVVARCVRVAVLIGVALTVAQTWVVDVLGLVNEDEWSQLTRSSRTAGVTLFLAFVLWEAFKYVTEPYMERKTTGALPGSADGDGTAQSASRLSTIMPLLRATVAVVLGVVAALIALEDFGVNTVPLLAGASVLGLAVSFGSQTLVRDIVSGIFYLTDDAFRVGEYIDCGKAKGTVEGFTLRSIKLRHQNGQVHTIPFGQLGQITNFSRDWITVKFNLRFARDTDVEKLRKAAKKIGTDMMEMPEFKSEILAPFKMQGIADIADNALLCRFKFTTKPGNPASIQREAVKRMFRTFPELGIEFAKEGAAVVLQTLSNAPDAGLTPEPGPPPSAAPSPVPPIVVAPEPARA